MISGLVLNLLMLIAGVGLVFLKGWGRAMSVFVAWAKIVRLLVLAVAMTAVVPPFTTMALAAMLEEQKARNPQAAASAPGPRDGHGDRDRDDGGLVDPVRTRGDLSRPLHLVPAPPVRPRGVRRRRSRGASGSAAVLVT